MIPVYEPVRTLLLSDPVVSGLLATRAYPDILPQAPTVPALVLQAWFVRDAATTSGASGFEDHRLQVDAYAATRAAADALMDAVANALDPRAPRGAVHISANVKLAIRQDTGSGRPLYDGQDTKLYRRSLDFKVQAARAA